MNKDIINYAKEIGMKIQNSDEFLNMKNSKEKMDSDESLNNLKQKFNSLKDEINKEMCNENSDRNKIKQMSDDLRTLYEQINDHKSVAEYELNKKIMNDLVSKVIEIINDYSYGKSNLSAYSCFGDCESCGGCF